MFVAAEAEQAIQVLRCRIRLQRPSGRSSASGTSGIRATIGTAGMAILVIIWAFTEYHNAGGWPTHGFSQS